MKYVLVEECCDILDYMRIPITSSDRQEGDYPYYGANGIQGYVNNYIYDDELVLLAEDGGNFGSKEKPIAYRVSGKCWVNNHAHVLKPKDGLNVDYLCYALMFYNVEGMINGATRQKLTQAAMKKMRIPIKSICEQVHIIEELNSIREIINKRRLEIQLLDKLIRARFVEMFGDPITNPKGYTKITVEEAIEAGYIEKPFDGNHGSKHPKASEYVEAGIPFLMANNILDGTVDLVNCSFITEGRANKLDKGFAKENDVLITHKGTIGRTAVLRTDYKFVMLTPQVAAYRVKREITSDYLCGYFGTDFFQNNMKKLAASGGSTRAYAGITAQLQLCLIIPPLREQKVYTDFVHHIDKSKVVVQKALDEAQLLFDSLMQKYFG